MNQEGEGEAEQRRSTGMSNTDDIPTTFLDTYPDYNNYTNYLNVEVLPSYETGSHFRQTSKGYQYVFNRCLFKKIYVL